MSDELKIELLYFLMIICFVVWVLGVVFMFGQMLTDWLKHFIRCVRGEEEW